MEVPTTSHTDALITRLREATNNHDLEALADCFHPDYDSEFPAHPERAFRGRQQMRENWSGIFASLPNLKSTLVRSASNQGTAWAEWEWQGTRVDGVPVTLKGVTIQEVRDGRVAWTRLYMEPVRTPLPGEDAGLGQLLGKPAHRAAE